MASYSSIGRLVSKPLAPPVAVPSSGFGFAVDPSSHNMEVVFQCQQLPQSSSLGSVCPAQQ
ncbi:hypothetical protein [uncultured Chryseobacterium sp.]|uniref:hypothetical protein n=1 Tax=uncultured Chryseobacterium sp. TaxID=259322 RepID=UPI0037489776